MAAAKAAALPVMGKLVSGALVKALTKLAGDEIEDQIGEAIEEAVRGTKAKPDEEGEGAAALAMEKALEKLGKEIDGLVDRRGAAMLAAYRQRKSSRNFFRRNMGDLVSLIDESGGPGTAPLIVIIDELDRCRPNYAIRMLEEVKHFFDIPNVVFIIALHGDQLSKSVKAIYGAEFDSDAYLRRFFTRRYRLQNYPTVELAAAIFEEWKIDAGKFTLPDPSVSIAQNYPLTPARTIGLALSEWNVTPREIYAVMDALRLFAGGWEHPEAIDPIGLICLLVKLIRGNELNFVVDPGETKGQIRFAGTSWDAEGKSGRPKPFSTQEYLNVLTSRAWRPLDENRQIRLVPDPAQYYLNELLNKEWAARRARNPDFPLGQSFFADYIPRISDLARFIDEAELTK